MLDKLIKMSTLSGVFLIFCGILKLIIFYSAFEIDIISYLSFSEIITSFLDDINMLLIFFAIMTMQTLIAFSAIRFGAKVKVEIIADALIQAIYDHRGKFLLIFMLPLVILSALLLFNVLSLAYWLIYCVLFLVIQLLTAILVSKDDTTNKVDITDASGVMIVIVTVITAVILLGRHDVQVVRSHRVSVSLVMDNSVIRCGPETSLLFLGKTDDYTFIYDTKNNSGIVFKVSDINSFAFKAHE